MPVPVVPLAVASHAASLWWTYRLIQTRSISEANKRFSEDWDALQKRGADAVALVRAVVGLRGDEVNLETFPAFARTVARSLSMYEQLPSSLQDYLRDDWKLLLHLEVESRYAYRQYSVMLANVEHGTHLAHIERIYHALYVAGRIDWPVSTNTVLDAVRRLQYFHGMRETDRDRALAHELSVMQSSTSSSLLQKLAEYPYIRMRLKENPEYIVHALMPLSRGALPHGKVAEEVARRFGGRSVVAQTHKRHQ